jgi:FkbH-like protein
MGISNDIALMPWRRPLSADWAEQWQVADGEVRRLGSGATTAAVNGLPAILSGLAGQQLGVGEQLKLEGTARRLVRFAGDVAPLRKFRVGLIGNRTLSYLINPLRAAGLARGLLVDAVEAPYDAVANFAYTRAPLFSGTEVDAAVVVLDHATFVRPGEHLDRAAEDLAMESAEALLTRLASAVRGTLGATMILATIPPLIPRIASADLSIPGTEARFVAKLNSAIAEGAARGDWTLWDIAELATRVGTSNWFDPIRFYEAKTPFRIEICPLVADHLCRVIAAIAGKTCRALVLDLDNTLWGGVIGDDGLAGIRLGQNTPEGEAHLALQRFALDLRKRGIVLAVCSKNNDATAREPFKSHPEMLLREEHFAVFQANWEDKATNIQTIADTLNLGVEHLAFVDDNPAERARVRQSLPLVSVPEVGDDPAYFVSRICDSGIFEHVMLNKDDIGRAESYESNAKRVELRTKVGDYDQYLQSLAMVLTVDRFDAVGRQRIAQLINKSNQFNLTTRRYNEEDVRKFEEDRAGILCWQARLDDTFGNHGMIGVVIVRTASKIWSIDTWLMSCRVLGRGVEETLMNLLVEQARAAGVEEIRGEYMPTSRNSLVADLLPRLGFVAVPSDKDGGVASYSCAPQSFVPLKGFIRVEGLPEFSDRA